MALLKQAVFKQAIKKIKTIYFGWRFDLGHARERQIATKMRGIRADHRGRYCFADKMLDGGDILDAASGIGYGSYILAHKRKDRKIWALDKDAPSHFFGNQYFAHPNILRVPLYAEDIFSLNCQFDAICSFETIEHLEDPEKFLKDLCVLSKDKTKLIVSSPNQETLPFLKEHYPHHIQHFTPDQLTDLLERCGWKVEEKFSQPNRLSLDVISGTSGLFLIYICSRK